LPDSLHLTAAAETERLKALRQYNVLDSSPEQSYDDITELAAFICDTPISLISLVDADRQWFKSTVGLGATETPIAQSFCATTVPTAQTLIVEDAATDPHFSANPLVTGNPNIRFYAGAPIIDHGGHVLGTVCVIDTQPRTLTSKQVLALEALARQTMLLLESRQNVARLESAVSTAATADKLVQDSGRRLQVFVDSFPALAWIANADGYITWYNRRWYEYTGTSPADMEGWGWQSVHDPIMIPSVLERWANSIKHGLPFEMVFPLKGADGVFRSFLTRIVPTRDESGAVSQWFGNNIEIDELQRTRLALETSEAVLNQVMNATTDAIVSVDRNWNFSYLNPMAEKLYGASKDLIGRQLWQVFPDAVYEGSPFVEHYSRAMNEGIPGSFEAEYGDPLNFTIGLEVYPSKDGIVTFSRDITLLKLATAAALQNEKLAAVGRLASSIAHEINNPLEAVTNLVYLARGSHDPAELDEYLAHAERELRRVSVITNQTLRFYKQTTDPTLVSGDELVDETLSVYQGRLLNSNVAVEKRMRATSPALCLEGEIRQVLSNIIGNAIDAMNKSGGRLILRSRDSTNWKTGQKGLALTIADTGAGMAAHVHSRVFDAFFSTKGIGGTGLGLWVSKEIVDRHQGTLTVRSSDKLRCSGTVFALFLPHETTQPDTSAA
jgi:PAS domain S-box-containing protein